jgi:hypothetical protein
MPTPDDSHPNQPMAVRIGQVWKVPGVSLREEALNLGRMVRG